MIDQQEWSAIRSIYDQVDDLILENKRLKKLAHDLQHEIELYQLDIESNHT